MTTLKQLSQDYYRVEQAIKYIKDNAFQQPKLSDIANSVNLSEYHFQRLFSRWTGISPKRFLQFLTKEYAKQLLDDSRNVLDVAYDAGLSGPGRLHDLFLTCEAVTPGEYQRKGLNVEIVYGIQPSPFGDCFLATTEHGICALRFIRDHNEKELIGELQKTWPNGSLKHSKRQTKALAEKVFIFSNERKPVPLYLYVKGTNFQIKVWEALLKIPLGKAVTYEDVARFIGMPKAARAVGNAVGRNPIPFLIPCHRVIRKMGVFGYYGEGRARKKAMLGWEAAHT
jgi:AraC family transcriptional regulator of adaptative response/methylated-DNA-[protein]-cysteine methyltransferase